MVRAEAERDKLPDGVQAVIADFDDPASIAEALAGAGRAYLVTPSSERAEEQQRQFCDVAAKAGIRQLVVLSQLGADEHSPVRFLRYHAAVEQHVRSLGIPYTFLRPNLFFQGLLAFARPIAAEGRFYAPIGDARVSAVDVRDIGAVAAVTLTEPGHEDATYTLTGPAAITHAQIAEAMTAALGRQVTFIDVSPSAFADSLRGVLPPWQVDGLLEDYEHYRRGEAAAVSSAIAETTGTPPRDVVQFARDYAPAFSDLSALQEPAGHHHALDLVGALVEVRDHGPGQFSQADRVLSDYAQRGLPLTPETSAAPGGREERAGLSPPSRTAARQPRGGWSPVQPHSGRNCSQSGFSAKNSRACSSPASACSRNLDSHTSRRCRAASSPSSAARRTTRIGYAPRASQPASSSR